MLGKMTVAWVEGEGWDKMRKILRLIISLPLIAIIYSLRLGIQGIMPGFLAFWFRFGFTWLHMI